VEKEKIMEEPQKAIKKNLAESTSEKYIRWQNIRIKQFSTVTNLILGLAAGMFGFGIKLLVEYKSFLTNSLFSLLILITLILTAASIISGIFCALSRLLDFRYTVQIHNFNRTDGEKKCFRNLTRVLGRMTWSLFVIQMILFLFGIISSAIVVLVIVCPP